MTYQASIQATKNYLKARMSEITIKNASEIETRSRLQKQNGCNGSQDRFNVNANK